MAKQVIAVCGATGRQGGSVARELLNDGTFAVRALTRNPASPKAIALKKAGAEVVTADFDDPDSIAKALQGCHGAFLVTNFWEGMDPAKEKAQGCTLADAASVAGVKHAVWSTLEDTRPVLNQTDAPDIKGFKVPHFDGKSEVDEYMMTSAGLGGVLTRMYTSIFLDNFLEFGMVPKRVGPEPDQLSFFYNVPEDVPLGWQASEDTGAVVRGIFKEGPEKWGGKAVGVVGDVSSWKQIAQALTEATGLRVGYMAVSDADARKAMQEAGAGLEFVNMMQYYAIGNNERFLALRDLAVSEALAGRKLATADDYFKKRAEEHKAKFTEQ